jgi:hypothetical protein
MKKFFIVLFLALAGLIAVMVYHEELLFAIQFLTQRPNQGLSDEELERQLMEVNTALNQINFKLERLSSGRPLGEMVAARDLRSQSQPLLATREGLLAEKAWREKRLHYFFLAGFILSLLIFLELIRRVLYFREPKTRRREGFWKEAERERVETRRKEAALAQGLDGSDPERAGLTPGSSRQEDVIALLGEPDQRSASPGLETWTYFLSLAQAQTLIPEKILELELRNLREKKDPKDTPGLVQDGLVPVVVIFEGDRLRDLSVGVSNDKNGMRRIL